MNISETSSSTQQNNTELNAVALNTQAKSTLQEAAQAFLRMDRVICVYLARAFRKSEHEDFKLQSLAQSLKFSFVSEWSESIESRVIAMDSGRTHILDSARKYLRSTVTVDCWAVAEVLFNQRMDRSRYDPGSGPRNVNSGLIKNLVLYSHRNTVLIEDLLPELVELKLFDLQMQAVLRGKWIILDSIMDSWFQEKRKYECPVPRWSVNVDFGCLRNGN